ncbi:MULTISPECIES: NAD(P)H-binding protein [unclassified Paenibacillus]|uniref:NAD(P)H-binding protein n=1 Tax=unclassified Paenibacillus TaxID=185978 RepID=UPI00210BA8D8|nr:MULTISPECIES: NAD(P)H-binding protein [unclassified Paenibacillus]
MTAFVRNSEKLYEQLGGRSAKRVKVIAGDMMDPVSVGEALAHQDAAIIAAGHAGQGEVCSSRRYDYHSMRMPTRFLRAGMDNGRSRLAGYPIYSSYRQ